MNRAIKQLRKVPGVIGGFVFNAQKGIVANSLPPTFRNIRLLEIGMNLSTMYGAATENIVDVYEISMAYENTDIIVRKVTEPIFLILICDPSIEFKYLNPTLKIAVDAIEKRAREDFREVSVEEVLESGPMSYALNGMKTSLATVLGPFSKIIFMDAMNEWLNENQPSFTTLSKLIDILVREIKDPEKVRQFIELIIPYVEPGKKK